jgi:hypothetical protein
MHLKFKIEDSLNVMKLEDKLDDFFKWKKTSIFVEQDQKNNVTKTKTMDKSRIS